MVEKLTEETARAVDRYTPDLRPSPYAKQWFTADLKSQQKEVNYARRRWQESYATTGRDNPYNMVLFEDMR
jgi:hypothetical protein